MKLASCSLLTSSTIARSHFWANIRFFYQTGGKEGDTFSLCTMTDGSIPDISSWFQANTSWFSLRKATIARQTVGLVRVPILVVLSNLELLRGISSSLSTGSASVRYSFIALQYSICASYLISSQFLYPVLNGEFNHQVIGWSYDLPWVKGWSSYDGIIGGGAIDNKECNIFSDLPRVIPNCYRQCDHAKGVLFLQTRRVEHWL